MVRFFYIYEKIELILLLKYLIRTALYFFCTKVHLKNKHLLQAKGPLLIIANHPNSFLDAIILGAYYKRRVYFLARGDVFKKKLYRLLLESLNMIPVYRLREVKENLHLNEYAFKKSVDLIKKGEAVLIFIEGTCINNHELQPFKKGCTRILEGLHKINIIPNIHITGIAYNNLRGIGKKINIVVTEFTFNQKIENAFDKVLFNKIVFRQLQHNIIIPNQVTILHKGIGYYIHWPYYTIIRNFVAKKTKGTVFYDSVLFSLLLVSYPIILLLIFIILYVLGISLPIIFVILLLVPLLSKNSFS